VLRVSACLLLLIPVLGAFACGGEDDPLDPPPIESDSGTTEPFLDASTDFDATTTLDGSSDADATPNADSGSNTDAGNDTDASNPQPEDSGVDPGDCFDEILNGDETTVDCGGRCELCPVNSPCNGPDTCISGRCLYGQCASPGYCRVSTDCPSDGQGCVDNLCIAGPTAGVTATPSSGTAPLSIRMISSARAGETAITQTIYDFGGGFETDTVHTFLLPGTYPVVQKVTDGNGLTDTVTVTVTVRPSPFTPTLLSLTDRRPSPEMEVSEDRLGMEVITGFNAGVRSTKAIQPGSGMYYFEGERLTDLLFGIEFGVATSAAPLNAPIGSTRDSVGVNTGGYIAYDGANYASFSGGESPFYGVVVDYRGTNPVVHVAATAYDPTTFTTRPRIQKTVTMSQVKQPLYVMVSGGRQKIGVQARINPGNDLSNFPFHYDIRALLNRAGLDGNTVVLGWGVSNAGTPDVAPVITRKSLTPASGTISLGASATVNAVASDPEDGTLTSGIRWVNLTTPYGLRIPVLGGRFTVTPNGIGIHPLEATIRDSRGQTFSLLVDINVGGTLPLYPEARLSPDSQSGSGIVLSTDGLSAKWTGDGKFGVRANQGMYGSFEYFEATRRTNPVNQGAGLVIKDGDLNPYRAQTVPPSCSINYLGGIWRNIIYQTGYDAAATSTYGLAVDYRGRFPIVYVITRDGTLAKDIVAHVLELDDVTVPIYPMLYGNPTSSGTPFDASINFGVRPFRYDPRQILEDAGYDSTGLKLGWGAAGAGT
jgi:hypothetical protein